MTLDRRDVVTSLAATGAATMLPAFAKASAGAPALPAHGGSFMGRRFYFSEGLFFSDAIPWSDAVYAAHYGGRWHFDPNPKGRALIRHEGSGLTFRRAPQPRDPFAMEAVFIHDPLDGWPDAAWMTAVGRAAAWPFLTGQNLCHWERRGAVYFRYRPLKNAGDDYTPPDVQDAPALSLGSHGDFD
jgi:hypothetical protein